MAYARFGPESDVYVYVGHVEGDEDGYVCGGCYLEEGHWATMSADEMAKHLQKHEVAGHKVPDGLVECIKSEIDTPEPEEEQR